MAPPGWQNERTLAGAAAVIAASLALATLGWLDRRGLLRRRRPRSPFSGLTLEGTSQSPVQCGERVAAGRREGDTATL